MSCYTVHNLVATVIICSVIISRYSVLNARRVEAKCLVLWLIVSYILDSSNDISNWVFQNDVSEKEQRWGSKTVSGSGHQGAIE